MNPEQEQQQLNILRDILCQLHVTHKELAPNLTEILAHLSRINETLDSIDGNLTLLEMKE